jgi:nucleoside-diphosphate-sugar epimerase
MIRESGLNATILRPWYVLGPGRRWPLFLKPVYWLMGQIPATRESAQRLGLVTIKQMIGALVWAVDNPSRGVRILGVPDIREKRDG